MSLLQAREQPWLDAVTSGDTDQNAVVLTAERERSLELSKSVSPSGPIEAVFALADVIMARSLY